MSKRVQVVFDERAVEVLERLQASTGGSMADVVRDAVGFYEWAREQVEAGKSIAVVDERNNRIREFIMPFRRK
jgi:IS1 family transposase